MAAIKDPVRVVRRAWMIWLLGLLLMGCRGIYETQDQTLTSPEVTPTRLEAILTQSPTPSPTDQITLVKTPEPTSTPRPSLMPTKTEKPTATEEPAASYATTPTATPTIAPQPRILSFEVAPQKVDPGDTVTLTWTSEGGNGATLYRLLQSGQFPEHGINVPTIGSITYTIDPQARNWVNFLLYVSGGGQASDNAGASVILHCPDEWFFSPPPDENVCPTAPLTSPAAEQTFQEGVMLWIEAEDAIYVLYEEDGYTTRWSRFQDEWQEGDPTRDPSLQPPSGLQQPIRGFGLVWRAHSYVRERLGWAVEPERGYQTTIQRTTRYKYNATYIRARDGGVWYLGPERSSWDKLVTENSK